MAEPAGRLEVWTVATFNVVAFGLVGVIAGHATGALSDALPDLGTLPGVFLFAFLWALAVVVAWWALAEGGLDGSVASETSTLLLRGAAAGGVAGLAFAVVVLGVALGANLLASGNVTGFVLVTLVGGGVGTVVGLVVGLVFTLADLAVYRAARWLVARDATDPGSESHVTTGAAGGTQERK
jgi:hypothetical protein